MYKIQRSPKNRNESSINSNNNEDNDLTRIASRLWLSSSSLQQFGNYL